MKVHISVFITVVIMSLVFSSEVQTPASSSLTIADESKSMSKITQSELIGKWKCIVAPAKPPPRMSFQSLFFHENGTVEYNYEKSPGVNVDKKKENYRVVHKGTINRFSGKTPTVILGNAESRDSRVVTLVGVSVDFDSRFPISAGKRLKFTDLEGNEYIFIRDGQPPSSIKSNSHPTAGDLIVGSKNAGQAFAPEKRIVNPLLTREICNNLQTGNLTEPERNKEILRLMNEGDSTCVPVLLEHLQAGHSLVVRQNAIRALGKIGDKQAVSPLLDILRRPIQCKTKDDAEDEAILRRNAVIALGNIGDPIALPVLKALAESVSEYHSVRDFARITARRMESK